MRGTPPVRILWGKGARRPNRHMCASNAHGTGTSHAQRGSCAKRAVVLLRLGTNTQNGKNFRNAEASRQRCSPHPLVQTIDSRHDTDDDDDGGGGGSQNAASRDDNDDAGGVNQDADTDSRGNKIHGVTDDGGLSKRLVPSSALRKFFPIPAFNGDYSENSRCKLHIAGFGVR